MRKMLHVEQAGCVGLLANAVLNRWSKVSGCAAFFGLQTARWRAGIALMFCLGLISQVSFAHIQDNIIGDSGDVAIVAADTSSSNAVCASPTMATSTGITMMVSAPPTWTVQASGSWLNKVWMLNATTGWAVGTAGTILYTSDGGTTWTAQASGTTEALTNVWGTDATHVWAIGTSGTILFYNGTTWTAQTSNTAWTLNGIWGVDATHVWAVGVSGTILFYDGTTWTAQTSGASNAFQAVWGTDASKVWIAGDYDIPTGTGTILSTINGGASWTRQTNTSTAILYDIWGADANNLWAVGHNGNIQVTTNGGASWTAQPSGGTQALNGISGIDVNNIWAVGNAGKILKYNGTTWTDQASGFAFNLSKVFVLDGSNVWGSGDAGTILKYNGSAWSTQRSKLPASNLNGIWGADVNNIWAVSNAVSSVSTVFKYNGTEWVAQTLDTTVNLNGIWGTDANNIWAVGASGTILKYDGSAWVAQNSNVTAQLNGIWGTDANNLWAVGNSGTICSTTDGGVTWTATTSGTAALIGIWGVNSSNIWAVGTFGTILNYNGTSWAAQTSGVSNAQIRSIWGTDANNLWAVANAGNIFSTTNGGATWSVQSLGTQTFRSVYGYNASNIWAVGTASAIYKYDGSSWSVQASPVSGLTNAGVINIGTKQWIAATLGTILTSSDNISCIAPTAYNVTGTDSYCAGGTGVAVGLDNSETGVTYQLKDASNADVGMAVNGTTGSAITFGNQTAGTYTVVATRTSGGCTATMAGSAVVTATPTVTPSVAISANPGNTITSGTSVTFTATPTHEGTTPSYQWKKNGNNVGMNQTTYTDAALVNGDIITCAMTSNAACALPAMVMSTGIMMTVASCPSATIIYVDNSATGTNDGSSWTNAFTDLNDALDFAHQCPNIFTIHVAGGAVSSPVIYKPTHKPYHVGGEETTTADPRDVTFQVRSGLAIYGGFPAGGGTRDPKTNIVILDGDINNDNNLLGNAYHTVLFVNPTVSAVLDGFVIRGGNANGTGTATAYTVAVPQNRGGGVYCEGGSGGYIRNCEVSNSYALNRGAGMFITNNSDLGLEFMNIRNNITGAAYGGGIAAIGCTVHLLTSLVHNNGANSGGGVFLEGNVVIDIKNSVITANSVTGAGGAGVGSWNNSNTLNIINTIIYQNSGTAIDLQGSETLNVTYSDIEGWVNGGTGVIDADPLFLNPANSAGTNGVYGDNDDGFGLGAGSPCAGTGGTPAFPWSLNDFAGNTWGGTYDMGAYKKQFSCPPSGTTILYVSATAATNGDGLSDSSPMQTLGEALDMAWKCPDVAEIRVAEGNYIPTHKPYNMGVNRIGTEITTTDDRDKTFHIRTGLKVSGGYDPAFTTQDPSLYPSFLSGDIGVGVDIIDNAYHVVVIDSSANWASNVDTTILSQFYVLEGNANNNINALSINDILVSSANGGGIYVTSGTNELHQLSIINNNAEVAGGCYTEGGDMLFFNNIVDYNISSGHAGGVYFSETNISYFSDNNFNNNTASTSGGGLYLYLCNDVNLNYYFAGNNMATDGAGIYVKECDNINIVNSSCGNNTATNAGSAIYFLDVTNVVLTNNMVSLNTVNNSITDGGAITFSNTTASMNFNRFDNNTSGAFGGAIHLNSGSWVTVSGDAYYDNTAINGGAIAVVNSQLILVGNRFCAKKIC